jgi:D-alanyl-D-alanine-carboxypeptidase/D-alanyl-D-alanine-endopeptidase
MNRFLRFLGLLGSLSLVGCERYRFDAAMAPVAVADLKPVLDADLSDALAKGPLAGAAHGGVAIGVVQHGVRRIYCYGTARPDSIFEIGSVTKTFTGLMLAQMAVQGQVRLDEPIRELLPPGTVAKPAAGNEITLVDLSDMHAALPRDPDNMHSSDADNPLGEYDREAMYAFLGKHGVAQPAEAPFVYNNLAVGLLGVGLANRAGVSYGALLEEQVTGPLGLADTATVLTPAQRGRLIQGYNETGRPVPPWELDALDGAAAIRSTAGDMLTYLEAQLHPERLPANAALTPQGKTLAAAITLSHIPRALANNGRHIALNWLRDDATGSYSHDGSTGGYSSIAIFNPEKDYAVVVLYNGPAGEADFAVKVGEHVVQRLTGKPAVNLMRRR